MNYTESVFSTNASNKAEVICKQVHLGVNILSYTGQVLFHSNDEIGLNVYFVKILEIHSDILNVES